MIFSSIKYKIAKFVLIGAKCYTTLLLQIAKGDRHFFYINVENEHNVVYICTWELSDGETEKAES